MKPIVHLHTHSHFSVLDGLGKPEEMIARAVEIGSTALAITDHGSISSLPALFRGCRDTEINPIIGCEFYVVLNSEGDKAEKRFHTEKLERIIQLQNELFPNQTLQERKSNFADFYHEIGNPEAFFSLLYTDLQPLKQNFSLVII